MNKPYLLIFFGFLAIMMSMGDDSFNFISSEIKLITGILCLGYGGYLLYNSKRANGRPKPSYIYLGIAVLILNSIKVINNRFPSSLHVLKFIILGIGIALAAYGLILFLREKRNKKESGNIE